MYKAFVIYFLLLLPCVSEATMVDLGEVIVSPKTLRTGTKKQIFPLSLSYNKGWLCESGSNPTGIYMQPLVLATYNQSTGNVDTLQLPNGLLLLPAYRYKTNPDDYAWFPYIGTPTHCITSFVFSKSPIIRLLTYIQNNLSDLKPGPFTYKVADIGPSKSPGKLPLDQVDTLQVTGNLIVTPCTLNTETMNVGFDEVLSISLPSTQKDIGMEVACLNGQSFYKASFTTTKSEGNVIIPTEGSARGIGIELVHSGVPIALNTPLQLTPGNANISARVVRQSGPIMSGDFSAVAELTFSYQ